MGTEASSSETIIWGCKMAKVLEPHIKQQTNIHIFGFDSIKGYLLLYLVFIRLLLQLNWQKTLWLLLEEGITVYVWLSMALDQNPLFLVDHKNRKCNFLCPF